MPDQALTTTCCIAGGGPAGLMLGLALARGGVDTIVRPPDTLAYLDAESMVITIPRTDYYQSEMLIPKGEFAEICGAGIANFRARVAREAQ